jgi:hypothetical protein
MRNFQYIYKGVSALNNNFSTYEIILPIHAAFIGRIAAPNG